jgi:hypothetical protein
MFCKCCCNNRSFPIPLLLASTPVIFAEVFRSKQNKLDNRMILFTVLGNKLNGGIVNIGCHQYPGIPFIVVFPAIRMIK